MSTVTEVKRPSEEEKKIMKRVEPKKTSQILPKRSHWNEFPKMKTQEVDTKSSKGTYQKTGMNRFDRDRMSPSKKGGFGCPEYAWQSPPALQKPNNNENQLNRMKSGYIPKQSSPTNKLEPYKFYAPVQIIAPTVYFNSNQSNKMVLKVNEYGEGIKGINP